MATTSRQAESNANAMLGMLLQGMMRGATVRYENTQVIEVHPGLRPDIPSSAKFGESSADALCPKPRRRSTLTCVLPHPNSDTLTACAIEQAHI